MYPDFICHHLNINPFDLPKKQPAQRSSKEHSNAVKENVLKLKQAKAIKEVFYLEWLANTVVVNRRKVGNGGCADFTDLNKTCLKDPFPLS